MSRYQFIKQAAATEPVQVLCRVLRVSSAGYYQWRNRPAKPITAWQVAAITAFKRHARRYGTRRLRAELQAEGHPAGRYTLRTWLRGQGLRALTTRPQRPRTTMADPAALVAKNLLLGQPGPTAPNQVWVGDSTYLPLMSGRWCYLATWRAAYSRRVVGWHLDVHLPTELVLMALEQALTLRQPPPGLIIYADRGIQYISIQVPLVSRGLPTRAACPVLVGQAIPMTTLKRKRAGARSKPSCCLFGSRFAQKGPLGSSLLP